MAKVIIIYNDGSKAVWEMNNDNAFAVGDYLYDEFRDIDSEILDANEPVDL